MRVLLLSDASRTVLELLPYFRAECPNNEFIYSLGASGKLGRFPKNIFNIVKLVLMVLQFWTYDVVVVSNLGFLAYVVTLVPTPFILLEHGNVAVRKKSFFDEIVFRNAYAIFYTTKNLGDYLPEGSIWLRPTIPIQFQDYGMDRFIDVGARDFYNCKGYGEDFAKLYGSNVYRVVDIPYEAMPYLFNTMYVFCDKVNMKTLSRSGLEALSCGCVVIDFEGNVHTEIPEEYRANREMFYMVLAFLELDMLMERWSI